MIFYRSLAQSYFTTQYLGSPDIILGCDSHIWTSESHYSIPKYLLLFRITGCVGQFVAFWPAGEARCVCNTHGTESIHQIPSSFLRPGWREKRKKRQPTNNTVPRPHKGTSTKRMKEECFCFYSSFWSRMRSTYGNTYIAPSRMTHSDTTRMGRRVQYHSGRKTINAAARALRATVTGHLLTTLSGL